MKGDPYKEWSDARLEHEVVFVSSRRVWRWWSGRRVPLQEAARAAGRAARGNALDLRATHELHARELGWNTSAHG